MFKFILRGIDHELIVSGDDVVIIHEYEDTAIINQRIRQMTASGSEPSTSGLGYVIKEISTTEHYYAFLSKHGYLYKDQAILMRKPERFAKGGTYSTRLAQLNMSEEEYNYVVTKGLESQTAGFEILEEIVNVRKDILKHSGSARTLNEFIVESGEGNDTLYNLMYTRNAGPLRFRGDTTDWELLKKNDVQPQQWIVGCGATSSMTLCKNKQKQNTKNQCQRKKFQKTKTESISKESRLKKSETLFQQKREVSSLLSVICTTRRPQPVKLGRHWTNR